MPLKSLILAYCLITSVTNYKILGVFNNPGKSHFFLGHALLKALAEREHQVTLLAPYSVDTKLPNFEIIEVPDLQPSKDEIIKKIRRAFDSNPGIINSIKTIQENFHSMNILFLSHPEVQNLLNSNRTFDLVILDWVFNDAFLGIAHHFKASSIVFSSFASSSLTNKVTYNPAPASYVPNIIPSASDDMNFSQRFLTFVAKILFEFSEFYLEPRQNRFLHTYFPKAPDLKTLIRNVSLVLVNSHFTIETPRPYVPNAIQIGGFHINKPKPLKGELKRFMDGAKNGVLYCSFGSIIKSSEFRPEILQIFINTFSKIPLRVLWKYEGDTVPNLPTNIKVDKWFPQLDVLAHPNTKIFLSHGGLLSLSEALYCGVPIIGIPFFGDHESNLLHGASKGYAIGIQFNNLTEESLMGSILEMINNSKYKENVRQRSEWFRDRPIKPLEKAIYWVEYVLRHKGAHHLKIHALKLNYIQYFMLDVYALFGAMIILGAFTIKIAFRASSRLLKLPVKEKGD